MNRNDRKILALAKKEGWPVEKRRIKKAKNDEKRLYDNNQDRICNNLPRGRTITVKDNEVL